MIIEIDTSTDTITVDGIKYERTKDKQLVPYNTLATELGMHRGVKEYDGVVAEIQKWYYGSLVKASWCATCVSYFANKMGILSQFGGKNENVYRMMQSCKKASPTQFYDKDHLPLNIMKGDVLFMLWSGDAMNETSSKHVTVAEYDSHGDTIYCIGGNQKDKICTLEYNRSNVYALFRPKY